MEIQKKYGYGDFGNLAKAYDKARREMPDDVLDYLFSFIAISSYILDVGCGTGIITRQLHRKGVSVIGADKDAEMLAVARSYKTPGIEYVEAPTENLPFESGAFDAVTAFSAFHWFVNDKALVDIARVLKPNGIYFVAGRNTSPDWRDGYKAALQPFMVRLFPADRDAYHPKEILIQHGFKDAIEKTFPLKEYQSVEEAVMYLQSTSPWNLVMAEKKEAAIEAMKTYFQTKLVDGMVEKPVYVKTVVAHKP